MIKFEVNENKTNAIIQYRKKKRKKKKKDNDKTVLGQGKYLYFQ